MFYSCPTNHLLHLPRNVIRISKDTGFIYVFPPGCAAPLGIESRKIRANQIQVSTYSTRINVRACNARLDNNGGWWAKTIENYVVKKKSTTY